MIIYATAATLATAVWAILLAASPCVYETLRCALVVSGVLAAVSFLVVDVDTKHVSALPGVVLVVYQCLLALSFSAHPVSTQAIVNCNTVVLVVYSWYQKPDTLDCTVGAASVLMAVCAAYIAVRSTPH